MDRASVWTAFTVQASSFPFAPLTATEG